MASKLRQSRAIAIRRKDVSARSSGCEGERFAAAPGAKIEDALCVLRRARERNELAALVLDLDKPGFVSGMIVDPAVDWQAQAPRAELRQSRAWNLLHELLARSSRRVHSEVERCPVQECGPFVRRN